MNLKGTLAYDGTQLFGWQKTRSGPSVEETLQSTIEQILQEPITLQAASRTDRGVHAEGQVFNFFSKKETLDVQKLEASIRALLPKDIALTSLEATFDNFHPTLDAKGKQYDYFICCGPYQIPFNVPFSWHIKAFLDLDTMRKAIPIILAQHDFSAFTSPPIEEAKALRRLTKIEILPLSQQRLCIRVEGESFLYKMVRSLVGTLVYIGLGKIALDELPRIFTEKKRSLAGITAPAHGLVLKRVFY